ncbi:nuclear transport factor 2 family protein [Adhaeribacter sp. BT258]|uniref:Nuclear transport factor 2 family protein n=1 Tax=Adhaeribacter terrigena TaxID=2793070 RepID=A0ABS1C2Y0_9BACT|nr:nuclear transport factor 2 family protein [Adhaeribacter terrigena]MBK0403522.1 nuclear transport factor 2 family protein [Adhaeribacter terrigena]
MKSIFSFLIALMLFTSCTKTEEKVNVSQLNSKFIGAWNAKQQDSVIAMIADDAHFLQGDVHYNGKSQIADNWVRKTMGTINNLKTSTVSSGADASIAYEAGTFSVDVPSQSPDEPNAYGEGNFMLLWKKGADGKWKLSYAQLEDHNLQVKP